MTETLIERNKRIIRQRVLRHFSRDIIFQLQQDRCVMCISWIKGHCECGMLPVQSDGSPCTYEVRRRDNANGTS